jgi:collagenase-like PrtC family protease
MRVMRTREALAEIQLEVRTEETKPAAMEDLPISHEVRRFLSRHKNHRSRNEDMEVIHREGINGFESVNQGYRWEGEKE